MDETERELMQNEQPNGDGSFTTNDSLSLNNQQQQILDFPSVLHFLHQEWRRFEAERNEWELEKTELKASLPKGEKKGFEVLKLDLLRRIKMLEFALRQERAKEIPSTSTTTDKPKSSSEDKPMMQKLSSSSEINPSPLSKIIAYSASTLGRSFSLNKSKTGTSRTKEILKQYLQEVGIDEKNDAASPTWNSTKYQTFSVSSTSNRGQVNTENFFQPPPPQQPKGPLAIDTKVVPDQPRLQRRHQVTDSVIYSGEDFSKLDELKNEADKTDSSFDGWKTIFRNPSSKTDRAASTQAIEKNVERRISAGFGVVDSQLADISVEDSPEDVPETASQVPETKLWHPKLTLRSHLDSIRSMAFHPSDLGLLTASEDGCVKYWNLEHAISMKKPPVDIEPIYTFRPHKGSINSIAVSTMIPPAADSSIQEKLQNGIVYSAGVDGNIALCGIPDKSYVPYSKYDAPKHIIKTIPGHEDVIWDIKLHSLKPLLCTASADSLVKFWDLNAFFEEDESEYLKSSLSFKGFNQKSKDDPIPTCIEFLHTDKNKILVGYTNSHLNIVDIESGQIVVKFEGSYSSYDGTRMSQLNKVISHNSCPLVVTAHEDRYIRFFDPKSAKCVHSMVAHLDAVSCLDISPNGLVLISGGHDGSTRLWELSSYSCLQEFTFHRKKFDESIHSVLFHPRSSLSQIASQSSSNISVSGGSPCLATSGADACAKLYTCE